MIDFGYTINKSSRTDLDSNNVEIALEVLKKEPGFASCIGCGCCAATCSSGVFTNLNLRMIQLKVHRGETEGLAELLNKCMLCGKCILVCPRNINTRNVIRLLQKELTKNKTDK